MKVRSAATWFAGLAGLAAVLACTAAEPRGAGESERNTAPLPPFDGTAYEIAAKVQLPETEPEEHPVLHNVFRLSDEITSGSEPHGEEAFRILQAKGIRTILSVDGKVPDAELAAKYGMKYVHVPIQYKGITDSEVAKLTKTFREQEGPFYVHCFHGKHRGPAAAEIGRLALDGIPREEALAEMRQWCGTAESYEGLYQTIAHTVIPSERETAALKFDFPAAHPLDGIAGAMVEISRAHDHLKGLAKHEWTPDASHPDVDSVNEATKLAAYFVQAAELAEVRAEPADFRQWVEDSKLQTAALRDSLIGLQQGASELADVDRAFKQVNNTCTACHDVYRN